jgi:hypothetical protein
MAKLSTKDKYTIQGALHDGKTSGEIAKIVGKPEKSVKNYIEGELDRIHETIAKMEIDKAEAAEKVEPESTPVPPLVKPTVLKLARGQGKRAMAYRAGASIMTEGASAVGDEFKKELQKTRSRTARGALYNSDGELIE